MSQTGVGFRYKSNGFGRGGLKFICTWVDVVVFHEVLILYVGPPVIP